MQQEKKVTYDEAALKRMISKIGLRPTLMLLGNPDLANDVKSDLSKCHFFVGGYPNVELILAVAAS